MSEDWEELVAGMLKDDRRTNSRKVSSATLSLLANLLDKNQLPACGRAHVANVLRAVAEGETEWVLPKAKKARGAQPVAIFAAVEREHRLRDGLKRDAEAAVGSRNGLEASTVARMASEGRKHVKDRLKAEIQAGGDRADLNEKFAQTLAVHPSVIEALRID
jgi:hypothetical protein